MNGFSHLLDVTTETLTGFVGGAATDELLKTARSAPRRRSADAQHPDYEVWNRLLEATADRFSHLFGEGLTRADKSADGVVSAACLAWLFTLHSQEDAVSTWSPHREERYDTELTVRALAHWTGQPRFLSSFTVFSVDGGLAGELLRAQNCRGIAWHDQPGLGRPVVLDGTWVRDRRADGEFGAVPHLVAHEVTHVVLGELAGLGPDGLEGPLVQTLDEAVTSALDCLGWATVEDTDLVVDRDRFWASATGSGYGEQLTALLDLVEMNADAPLQFAKEMTALGVANLEAADDQVSAELLNERGRTQLSPARWLDRFGVVERL